MDGRQLRSALRNGKRVYGTLIVSHSPVWASVVKSVGVDFVFIDTEAVPLDRAQLSWMCRMYSSQNIAAIVRVPSIDVNAVSMALDAGADGIVVPYVESVNDAKLVAAAVRYAPIKGRQLEELVDGNPVGMELKDYCDRINSGKLAIINVESRAAIEDIDALVKVQGLDAVLVGPHDLSCSLGDPENYSAPEFVKAVETVIDTARDAGIGAGIHVTYSSGFEQEIEWARNRANLLLHSGDVQTVKRTLAAEIKYIRDQLGDPIFTDSEALNI